MTKELKHTDVSHAPELLRLAEEVQRTQEPRVLVRQAEKLALLMPVSPTASTEMVEIAREDHLKDLLSDGK